LKASIILNTYNRVELLPKALDSALKQNYKNLEIIINNDCSTDSTEEFLKPYLKDKRIIYNKNTKNKGQFNNLMYSIKDLANGEWVFLLADDDYFENHDYISNAMELALYGKIDDSEDKLDNSKGGSLTDENH